jgi:hypothetical protein
MSRQATLLLGLEPEPQRLRQASKASANPTPLKKIKKEAGKPLGRIKINEPPPQDPASTPPSGPRKGIPIY